LEIKRKNFQSVGGLFCLVVVGTVLVDKFVWLFYFLIFFVVYFVSYFLEEMDHFNSLVLVFVV